MRLSADVISEESNHYLSSSVDTKTHTVLPLYLYLIHTLVTVTALAHTTQNTLLT
jgi:hypothetical protein